MSFTLFLMWVGMEAHINWPGECSIHEELGDSKLKELTVLLFKL